MINEIIPELIPKRATKLSAGYDILSPVNMVCKAGENYFLDTGVKLTDDDLAEDVIMIEDKAYMNYSKRFVALLLPRSSLGFKYGFKMDNTVGVIDSDYRDSIKIPFTVSKDMEIKMGDKIAQLVFIPFTVMKGEIVPSIFRKGGFGSTDISQQNLDNYQKD